MTSHLSMTLLGHMGSNTPNVVCSSNLTVLPAYIQSIFLELRVFCRVSSSLIDHMISIRLENRFNKMKKRVGDNDFSYITSLVIV